MAPDLRPALVAALAADLVGPYSDDEVLRLPPSRWYLTGFLTPRAVRDAEPDDPTADDELGDGDDTDDEDSTGAEPEPKQKNRLPASMGLSVLLPPGAATDLVTATVTWADYALEETAGQGRAKLKRWRRVARGPVTVTVPLDPAAVARGVEVERGGGVWVKGKLAVAETPELASGTRALSLFVVNERGLTDLDRGRADEKYLFQVELTVTFAGGLVPRPNRHGERSDDLDDRIADLQFRGRVEYAVGHGVSVQRPVADPGGVVTTARTTWLPTSEVRRVVTFEEVPAMVAMDELATLADGAAVHAALDPLVDAYGAWIERQRHLPLDGRRAEVRDHLLAEARRAHERIAGGIELLAGDPAVLDAFRLANRAMATQARQRNPAAYASAGPRWRLFQLAFVLLNLRSIARDDSPERDTAELIFFPTGGGKTEAYLGVIAFTLVWRRLQGQGRDDRGLGVAVILRYTLRLLTLDQLGRAATLVCALERLRGERPKDLGTVRFAVGLWVGKSATANTMREISERLTEYKASVAKNPPSPFPLTDCPWCGRKLGPHSFDLRPSKKAPTEVIVGCLDPACAFSPTNDPLGLPVVFVDEQLYRELPAFVIATLDKFALMPHRGEVGMLFGRVVAHDGRAFLGPLDDKPMTARRLPGGLRPPELIVQDELHLISGPLGTMAGLYEIAVEALCTRTEGDRVIRPKLLAATATVRRAGAQIQALMGRAETRLFPPPGPDDSETFFARVDGDSPGRLYVGVAAPGRAMKAITLRTYVALLAAAQRQHEQAPAAADGYMTLAGYFNSLRELGGTRRLVEDDVRVRCAQADLRRPVDTPAPHRHLASRVLQKEPVELTSRERTTRIAESKARLGRPHTDPDRVDVLLASNMISVGIDIDRLGLMVIAGQPKTTAEYIQASSRVGRQTRWPGLVVTCFNLHKPRDRSHYEQFDAYHQSFYRSVEVTSLTPFAGPALDRGLVGALFAMARLLDPRLTPPRAAMDVEQHRREIEVAVEALARRAGAQPGLSGPACERQVEAVRQRARNLVDAWASLAAAARKEAGGRSYSSLDRAREAGKPILFTPLDGDPPPEGSDEAKFAAPTSMRDVEPTVHLWVERRQLGGGKS